MASAVEQVHLLLTLPQPPTTRRTRRAISVVVPWLQGWTQWMRSLLATITWCLLLLLGGNKCNRVDQVGKLKEILIPHTLEFFISYEVLRSRWGDTCQPKQEDGLFLWAFISLERFSFDLHFFSLQQRKLSFLYASPIEWNRRNEIDRV